MKRIMLVFGLLWCVAHPLIAQISGNAVYRENNYSNDYAPRQSASHLLAGDSLLYVDARVAINVIADAYLVTFGVMQEGKTVKECNEMISKRIDGFKADLKKLEITDKDIYVDLISQNKIYDYSIKENNAEQTGAGFELKKNVIVRFKKMDRLDEMMVMASVREIYDIVKVDYIVTDVQKVYSELLLAATEIIRQKKDLYIKSGSFVLLPSSKPAYENFYAVYPDVSYKSYRAFESSEVEQSYGKSSGWKKTACKSQTFYFDRISYSGFDKVINPDNAEIGVQFVLEFKIQFDIKKK